MVGMQGLHVNKRLAFAINTTEYDFVCVPLAAAGEGSPERCCGR
jgi:hypothetical protein